MKGGVVRQLPDRDELVEVTLRWRGRTVTVTGMFDALELRMQPIEYPGVAGEMTYLPGPKTAALYLHSVNTELEGQRELPARTR